MSWTDAASHLVVQIDFVGVPAASVRRFILLLVVPGALVRCLVRAEPDVRRGRRVCMLGVDVEVRPGVLVHRLLVETFAKGCGSVLRALRGGGAVDLAGLMRVGVRVVVVASAASPSAAVEVAVEPAASAIVEAAIVEAAVAAAATTFGECWNCCWCWFGGLGGRDEFESAWNGVGFACIGGAACDFAVLPKEVNPREERSSSAMAPRRGGDCRTAVARARRRVSIGCGVVVGMNSPREMSLPHGPETRKRTADAMLLKNIDLSFYPSLPLNYKFSADGQLCIPAAQGTYILSNSILNPDLVSNPPVPSKFRPGDENKIDYRAAENKPGWRGYRGDSDDDDPSDSGNDESEIGDEAQIEADVEDDKARPEFQFHWQKLEVLDDEKQDDVMNGAVIFQLEQTFKEGYARQMEWSPLGAGRYKRCSLAILTTSRQVLIYQPATVVGRGLKLSMKLLDRLLDQDVPGDEEVEVTWDKLPRVLEICWSHLCTFPTQRWGVPVLTMVDEHNALRFVKIVGDEVETLLETTFDLPENARILGMCWSPWLIVSPVEGISFLTFNSGAGIYLQQMAMANSDSGVALSCVGEPSVISDGMVPGYEPHAALWYNRSYNLPGQPPEVLLAVIQHDGVEVLGVSLDHKRALAVRRRAKIELELPARPTGFTFSDPLWANYLDLNISSANGGLAILKIDLADLSQSIVYKAITPTFKGPQVIRNDPAIPHPDPSKRDWIDILNEKRDSFITEWKIMHASCHVYGMAYSPLGGILTVCYRLKPEGVLEYPIKERERCTLSWDLCRTWSDMFDSSRAEGSVKPFTLFGVCAEAFVSDLRFLVDPDEAEESFGKMEEVIAKGTVESDVASDDAEKPHCFAGVSTAELAGRVALSLFNTKEAVLLRARNLLGLLKAGKIAPKKPGVLTAQRGITQLILRTVLEVPIADSPLFASRQSVLTMRLLARLGVVAFYRDTRIMRLSIMAVDALDSVFGLDVAAERDIIEERNAILRDPGNLDLLASMTKAVVGALESCSICGFAIPFDDLMSARCESGHIFRRCAVSFTAITDANARVCGLCSREYITLRMVEADGGGEMTLFGMLYEAVDSCVFCGGGFYDKAAWGRAES
ncbi:LOW QUALITY PROTEIN: hypothetical protein Dda_8805 [Drechslerella dactyloides]|uniref:Transcription factor IIIC putative zinc-finger domain-containing protein n=1 Tax=Drechslerella dactyloides TaxID=74499 RepID=A0AAD6IQ80_DREDA|nr:LOW QUALITY PROTEIN: hypothetical protein Dda_8805 [Drechslerella dactyloides]